MIAQPTLYALTALTALEGPDGERKSCHQLAVETHLPEPYLGKILAELSRVGIVDAVRGRGGGYRLAVEHDRLTALDICRVMDDPVLKSERVSHLGSCSSDHECLLCRICGPLRQHAVAALNTLKVQELRAGAAAQTALSWSA